MPPSGRAKGIAWLEIHQADGGYYLLQFADQKAPPKWDSFFAGVEDVLEECQRTWGIDPTAWQSIGG